MNVAKKTALTGSNSFQSTAHRLIVCCAFVGLIGAAIACDTCVTPVDDKSTLDMSSNDPTFMTVDHRPAQSLATAQSKLQQDGTTETAPLTVLNQSETAQLNDATRQIKESPSTKALDIVMDIWRGNHTSDMKRGAILQGIAKSSSSEDVEVLQFMVAALDDLASEKIKIAELGRGNGLEKQMAAKRLLLLNENPQTRVSQ